MSLHDLNNKKGNTMTTIPTTISIDGTDYVRADSNTASDWRIVIAQRGWVFVGRYVEDGDDVTLYDAKNIRIWGTTEGLGQLAIGGKTSTTVLDPAGTVRLHKLAIVATLDTQVTTW